MPFFIATLVATSRDQLHAFFVAASYDAAQFAIYAVGTIQLPLVNQFMQSIGETIVLENSKNYATGQLSEMRRVWHRATYFMALVMLPLFFIMEFFAADVISVVFGANYVASADVWRVFVLMLPLTIMLGATMLRATGDLKRMIAADLISLAVTIATLVLLSKPLGVLAAVWSIVLGNAALNFIVAARVIKRLGFTLGNYMQWITHPCRDGGGRAVCRRGLFRDAGVARVDAHPGRPRNRGPCLPGGHLGHRTDPGK